MMRTNPKIGQGILFALIFAFGLTADDTHRIEKAFAAVKTVSVKTVCGDLNLDLSPDGQIHVLVTHTFSPERYTSVLEVQDEELFLSESLDRGAYNGQSRWTVSIPAGTAVKFVSASGGCRARDLQLDLKIRNASGDVELSRVQGRFEVRTASGDLEGADIDGDISFNGASGNVKLSSIRGNVKIYGASSDFWCSGLKGDAAISLASGDLVIKESRVRLKAGTASGDISARDIVLEGQCQMKSASGSLLLRLASPISADLTMKSASGTVTLQLNGNPDDAEFVCTTGKDRGRIMAPFDFDFERIVEKNRRKMLEKTARRGKALYRVLMSSSSGDLSIEK